jgi:hypothetical protein
MVRLLRLLRDTIANVGNEPKETWSALACIGLIYALLVVLILTWGPQP